MRAYLREHWRVIAAFFVFAAVFGVTFALYGLPLEAVAYPAGLCLLLGGLLALEDKGLDIDCKVLGQYRLRY